jgi:membrane protein YqaA with SNARE-associated domain
VVRRFLDWVMGIAETMGGPGLFIISFLDSSFLSFPEVVDVLMIGLVAKYPERMLYYATLPTLGSVLGSYILYHLARRGGEAFLRRRVHERHVDRAFRVVRKYGLFAVAVPAIMPPPVPFKIFVLAAGAARVGRRDFLIAITIGRGLRYFGEALLAAWYGQQAIDFLHEHGTAAAFWIAGILLAGGLGYIWWTRRRGFDSSAGSSV